MQYKNKPLEQPQTFPLISMSGGKRAFCVRLFMSESGEKKLSISWYGERKVKYVWKSECWRDTNCVGK